MKTAFWKFLFLLLAGLLGAVAIPFGGMLLGVTGGMVTYADSSEQSVKNLTPVLAVTPDLDEIQLPQGCESVLLDKNYHVVESTLEGIDLEHALEYAKSGKNSEDWKKQYLLVSRENEYLILQYSIGSQFTNAWLNEHLPSPELLMCLFMGINCILVCTCLTTKFAKRLRTQLAPVFEATGQVAKQNLDFEVGHSQIQEFEEVLQSFSEMKKNLQSSLTQQWAAEQAQKEQIAALAHDLKTPLTVIQGNVDLMSETELNAEQREYADYISESSQQMERYIKTLIDISRASTGYQLFKEKVGFLDFMARMKEQMESLCRTRDVSLVMETDGKDFQIEVDIMLLERALMNVVNNALDYSPENTAVYVAARCNDTQVQITVTDEGCGFSPEALQHAQERFYMGDRSRSSRLHFGMGLYIASSILQQHGDKLVLQNRMDTHGGKVILEIPT